MIGRRSSDDAQSFEEAWTSGTPRDEHIAGLVHFAESLCAAAVAEPSLQFRESLRSQLMTEAATVLVPLPQTARFTPQTLHPQRPVRRRVAGLTAAVVASVGVVGIVASSASAVPGEMLYPVKRSVESVELQLHRDDASRGSYQLSQASERLAEAWKLGDSGGSESLIADTLDDFATQASSGSSKLFNDFSDNGEEKSIRKVNDFAAAASVNLSEMSSVMPASAGESFRAATGAVSELATQASSLCDSCTSADVQSLVSAVSGLTTQDETQPSSTKDDTGKKSSTAISGPEPSKPANVPTNTPAVVPTVPTLPPTKTPPLSGVTDPVVGGLLGDDNHVGLVPSLLNGLLGGGSKK